VKALHSRWPSWFRRVPKDNGAQGSAPTACVVLKGLPPQQSAGRVLVRWQRWFGFILVLGLPACLILYTQATLISLLAASVSIYTLCSLYKLAVTLRAFWSSPEVPVSGGDIAALDDDSLPVYTILLPVYREANVVHQLIESVTALNYPQDKLDVKILLEADDRETAQALAGLELAPHFEVVEVPEGKPQGKPRACNFGLYRARGKFCALYDAEDRPDPDQLKKALIAFAKGGERVACVQAKLSYYNPSQNLLTRWFTTEYSAWFDLVLPGLHACGAPIPLGGTSNHFRVDVLREVGSWDAFNVTEDADLGVRLYRRGWRTVIIDSVTYEEANSNFFGWIRQRSRWIKGYIQTWLVHMRNPLRLLREMGLHGFLSFQVMVGGTIFSYLANPIFWAMTGVWYISRPEALPALFPLPVFYIGTVAFVAGNLFFIYSHVLGCLRHRQYSLVKYAWTMPIYWLLMSVALWKAIFQLVRRPHYWEKTEHGLDGLTQAGELSLGGIHRANS
jgi:cellulose synthase/poly-beta-1,6-N-acetylglucosamine synthase-like glycosyltransferase